MPKTILGLIRFKNIPTSTIFMTAFNITTSNIHNNPEREKNDDEVREDIETVTPDTENLQPVPDQEDEKDKAQ